MHQPEELQQQTLRTLGTAPAGRFALVSPRSDIVFRLTPYQAGEPLRPEAKVTASVTEGQPPLTAEFSGTGGERMRWDFGDGSTSDLASPTHVFQQPGLYSVTLTVTDARGGVGQSVVEIAVDRDSSEPDSSETRNLPSNCTGLRAAERPVRCISPTARRGAGREARIMPPTICAACGPSRSWAGSSRKVHRSAAAAIGSCSA